MELLNQIAGVIGCIFAAFALALGYIVAPSEKQVAFKRMTMNVLTFLLFTGGILYVVIFSLQTGSVTHAEVLMLAAWLFNIRIAIMLRPKFQARQYKGPE